MEVYFLLAGIGLFCSVGLGYGINDPGKSDPDFVSLPLLWGMIGLLGTIVLPVAIAFTVQGTWVAKLASGMLFLLAELVVTYFVWDLTNPVRQNRKKEKNALRNQIEQYRQVVSRIFKIIVANELQDAWFSNLDQEVRVKVADDLYNIERALRSTKGKSLVLALDAIKLAYLKLIGNPPIMITEGELKRILDPELHPLEQTSDLVRMIELLESNASYDPQAENAVLASLPVSNSEHVEGILHMLIKSSES